MNDLTINNRINQTLDVIIIGAGFSGLGMAIQLQQANINNIAILERDKEVGGCWRDNQYPGAACDIPSHLYSFSFAPNPNWSRAYSNSHEILEYIKSLVSDFELQRYIRFNTNVSNITFDEKAGFWTIKTDKRKALKARSIVIASGPLANCSFPNIPNLKEYKGHKIHSARWDHNFNFSGKKVALVGTGASAIQIIPKLVKKVKHLTVFQRTPAWVLPRLDAETPQWISSLFRELPSAQKLSRQAIFALHEVGALGLIWNSPLTSAMQRVALKHLQHQVKDDWMQRQLTPNFRIGCKRVLMSNNYYPALQQPNCKLITWPIARMSEKGIRCAEGIEHQFDCIVFATGFDIGTQTAPFSVKGVGGRDLGEDWKRGAQAYKSINVSGYPNLFLTFGPNSGPGHNSALVYVESQLNYAVQGIQRILNEDLAQLDVQAKAQEKYNIKIQKRLSKTNWNSGCKSWYLTEDGFNATMFPGFATQYSIQMRQFKDKDYHRVSAI